VQAVGVRKSLRSQIGMACGEGVPSLAHGSRRGKGGLADLDLAGLVADIGPLPITGSYVSGADVLICGSARGYQGMFAPLASQVSPVMAGRVGHRACMFMHRRTGSHHPHLPLIEMLKVVVRGCAGRSCQTRL
jgi:hypothetical protein